MAQAGYTPIQLYFSTTAAAVPTSGNLANGELGINIQDEKLYFKNAAGTVKLLASNATSAPVLTFSAGTTGFTPSSATSGAVTLGGTLITSNGGTGLASYTAGDLSYYASGTALTKLAIGTAGQFLTSTGTAPQWSTLSGVAVTTFSAGTTGFTPNTATSGAITLAGTLATTNGGTGLTSFTSGGVVYASSSSALATGSALVFDGTNLGVSGNGTFNTGASGGVVSGNSSYSGYFSALGGGSGATIGITPSTISGANGVVYNTSFVAGGNGPHVFQVGGSESIRITSTSVYTASGVSVGIGTSSPSASLSVINATSGFKAEFVQNTTTTGDYTGIGFSVTTLSTSGYKKGAVFFERTGANAVGKLHLANNSTADASNAVLADAKLTIDSAGLVGVGTTSPTQKLDVVLSSATAYSSGVTGNGLRLYNSSTTTGQYVGITFQGEPTAGNGGLATIMGTTTGSGNMDLTFSTRSSATLAERMRISSAGAVSITGIASTNNMFQVGSSNSTLSGWILGNNSAGSGGIWSTSVTPSGTNYTLLADGGTTTLNSTTAIVFAGSNSERARITNAGQLLVGTTTTSGAEVARFQNATTAYVGIIGATNGGSYLNFGDTSDGNVGYIGYDHTSNYMAFRTNSAENMRISSAGYVTLPNQPAFMAYSSNSAATFTAGAVIVFDGTNFNTGSNYSTANGRFTAPVAGVYHFCRNQQSSGASNQEVMFYKNGSQVNDTTSVYSVGANGNNSSIYLSLAASDYVTVYQAQGTSNGDYNNFSGSLIN